MMGSSKVKHGDILLELQQWQYLAVIPRQGLALLVMSSPRIRGKSLKGNPLKGSSCVPSGASKCSSPDGERFLADEGSCYC